MFKSLSGVCSLALFAGLPAFGSEGKVHLKKNFSATVTGTSIRCAEGSMSGDYPSPTVLSLNISSASSSLRPNTNDIILNTKTAIFESAKNCASFKTLLNSVIISAQGVQEITEDFAVNDRKECLKIFHEKVKIDVGKNEFSGDAHFVIGPLESKLCQ